MDIKNIGQNLVEGFLSLTDKLIGFIPEEKRRLFFLVLGGIIFLAICLTIMAIVSSQGASQNSRVQISNIPAEELFYPREPDFLPPLLLEREPHQPWTTEDLEFFWRDPKTDNIEIWREAVKTAVDKLLDGVP